MKFFQKKKQEIKNAIRIVALFKATKSVKKLRKKDLEIIIDGYKFHFIDIPLVRKEINVKY